MVTQERNEATKPKEPSFSAAPFTPQSKDKDLSLASEPLTTPSIPRDRKRKLLNEDVLRARESVKDLQAREQQAEQEDQDETDAMSAAETKLQGKETDLGRCQAELQRLEGEIEAARSEFGTAKKKYEEKQAKRQRLTTELEEAKEVEAWRLDILQKHDKSDDVGLPESLVA